VDGWLTVPALLVGSFPRGSEDGHFSIPIPHGSHLFWALIRHLLTGFSADHPIPAWQGQPGNQLCENFLYNAFAIMFFGRKPR